MCTTVTDPLTTAAVHLSCDCCCFCCCCCTVLPTPLFKKLCFSRHTFEYQPKPSASCGASVSTESGPAGGASVSSADVQRITRAWVKFCQDAPAKPVSCVFGADLGLGKELYPGKSNLAFGGSLDFKSEVGVDNADHTTPQQQGCTCNRCTAANLNFPGMTHHFCTTGPCPTNCCNCVLSAQSRLEGHVCAHTGTPLTCPMLFAPLCLHRRT